MRGPHGKGYAEMAVARVPGLGYETPLVDDDRRRFDEFQQALQGMGNRRMSDTHLNRHLPSLGAYRHYHNTMSARGHPAPSASSASASNSSAVPLPGPTAGVGSTVLANRARSEADTVNQYPEVDANSIDDG